MIKFYQGTYDELSTKNLLSSNNNICFVTDRQVLIMGNKLYGKDSGGIKIEAAASYDATSGATGTRQVADGTVFFFQGDQSLWQYKGANADPQWVRLLDGTLYSTAFGATVSGGTNGVMSFSTSATTSGDNYQATARDITDTALKLESKISAAYTQNAAPITPASGDNTVVVSKSAGIARTNFTLNQDRSLIQVVTDGSGAISAPTAAGTILVTETTLAEQTNDILANGLTIKKLTSSDTALGYNAGYRSQYALINKQTGGKLGETIDLIKDQFLKAADYVIAFELLSTWYEYKETGTGTSGWVNPLTNTNYTGSNAPSVNAANRYLKLTFAVSDTTGDNEGTASDNDSIVYLNVNELFDSYTGVSGVAVNGDTNQISAVINSTANEAGTGTGTHFSGAFLKNSTNGLYVEGIKQEITGYIQDLGSDTSDANYKFLTGFGVAADGTLTGDYAQASAANVAFGGTTGTTALTSGTAIALTGSNVADAISAIATHIGSLDYSYNGNAGSTDNAGTVTQFVYAITETDGKIATSSKIVDASDLKAMSYAGAALSATQAISTGIDGVQAGGEIGQVYTISTTDNTSGAIQDALTSIVNSVTNYFNALDLTAQGVQGNVSGINGGVEGVNPNTVALTNNTAVQFIEQENGLVNVKMIDLAAQNIGFAGILSSPTHIPVDGYNVGAALSSISQYIGSLDVNANTSGAAPTNNGTTKYTIVNTVSQDNGKISATTVDLTSENTYQNGITEALTSGTTAANARVGITKGSQAYANDQISNLIADYCSFHDANGNII